VKNGIGLTLPIGNTDLELLQGRDMRKERSQVGAWTIEQKPAQVRKLDILYVQIGRRII
jgi:hypothetical protein